MQPLPEPPEVEEENRSELWNNLPYCGLYIEPIYDDSIILPSARSIVVHGQPLPLTNNGINKNLRLIGFQPQDAEAPVRTNQPWRLVVFSVSLKYRVKWSVSSKCKIGFYTPNYLSDPNPFLSSRQTLLIGKYGPSLFEGRHGTFCFTGTVEFTVIVDKDVSVRLEVECKAPCNLDFAKLKLFKPVPYHLHDGRVYANETKLDEFTSNVSFVPTKCYITLTAAIRKYLIATSILLDFTPTIQGEYKLLSSTPARTFNNLGRMILSNGYYYVVFPNMLDGGYDSITVATNKLILSFITTTDTSDEQKYVRIEYHVTLNVTIPNSNREKRRWFSGVPLGYVNPRFVDYDDHVPRAPPLGEPENGIITYSYYSIIDRTNENFLLRFSLSSEDEDNEVDTFTIVSATMDELTISYIGESEV